MYKGGYILDFIVMWCFDCILFVLFKVDCYLFDYVFVCCKLVL